MHKLRSLLWLFLAALMLTGTPALADATIIIDGEDTGDWPDEPFYFLDSEGDMPPPWGDLNSIMITDDNTSDDDGNLYLGIEFYNRFRETIGSNDVDVVVYLDTDMDGVNDFAVELTEGTVTDLSTGSISSIGAMDYSTYFLEASIPYSVLGLTHGSDTFALYVAIEGKPGGEVEYSPEPGDSYDGYQIYDGTTGDDVEPLAVKILALGAQKTRSGVALGWSTGLERGNLGFRVYRQRDLEAPVLISKQVIPGLGHSPLGRDYRFDDPKGQAQDLYWIEDLDQKGRSKLHGPLVPLDKALVRFYGHPSRASKIGEARPRIAQPSPKILVKKGSAKYALRHKGLHRLDHGRSLNLSMDGRTVTVLRDGSDSLFYVDPQTDRHADFSVLLAGRGKSRQMARSKVSGTCKGALTALPHSQNVEEDHNYFIAPKEGESFLWTWSYGGSPAVMAFEASHPVAGQDELSIDLRVIGLGTEHNISVSLNGIDLGQASWSDGGMEMAHMTFSAPSSSLVHGANRLTVEPAPGSPWDILYLDGFTIDYQRRLSLSDGSLTFSAPDGTCLELDGLEKDAAEILLDISDPRSPVQLRSYALLDAEGQRSLRFETGGKLERRTRTYFLTTAEKAQQVEFFGWLQSGDLATAHPGADYLVISHPDFADAAQRLADYHRSQGLSTMLVTTEQVYDQFGHGRPSPKAIRSLLTHARASWQVAPRYVLLMGGATVDPNGYTFREQPDYLPAPFLLTHKLGYEAAADSWYVSDGGQPWAAIGRLAVSSREQADALVDKLLAAYSHQLYPSGSLLFVADETGANNQGGPLDFAQVNSRMIDSCLPAHLEAVQVDKGVTSDPRAQLIQAAQTGLDAMVYLGHGFMGGWSYDPVILDGSGAAAMSNQKPFLLISGSCFDGAFPGPWVNPLAWEMVANPTGGAWAATASSMTVNPQSVATVAEHVLCLLTSGSVATLGEALLQAKTDLAGAGAELQEALDTYHLLGDPAAPNPFIR